MPVMANPKLREEMTGREPKREAFFRGKRSTAYRNAALDASSAASGGSLLKRAEGSAGRSLRSELPNVCSCSFTSESVAASSVRARKKSTCFRLWRSCGEGKRLTSFLRGQWLL